MGNFISLLSKAKGEPHKIGFFSSNSLSKIKEYYALYRKISDTFAIDDSEFAEIFGNRMDVF